MTAHSTGTRFVFGFALTVAASFAAPLVRSEPLFADDPPPVDWRPSQRTALDAVAMREEQVKRLNRSIWEYAEVGLRETRSSTLLIDALREAGFEVRDRIAGMPTAFVASYGQGKPVIGILAEYDALPGMSQRVGPAREPQSEGAAGHACGHSGLGAAAVVAAIAVRESLAKHGIPGTIRLYGTPAEETVIGKVYMTLDGQFDDLDICLHWHPSDKNGAWASSSKALVSAKFTFSGTPAHASVSPESGRSALDAVELMNAGANFMREHLPEDARVHYVITDGGGQPNVVPPTATVWYFVRADTHDQVERMFEWLHDIARGAAIMTRTKVASRIDTDCHEVIPNDVLSNLLTNQLERIGAPEFTDEERLFARRLQEPLRAEFGTRFDEPLDSRVHRWTSTSEPNRGSTDVGDISWRVPTGGLRTTCFVLGAPGHSWQNVASIGSTIGEKGSLFAAKGLSAAAMELFEDSRLVAAAREDWTARMKDRSYFSFIPEGQRAPDAIR